MTALLSEFYLLSHHHQYHLLHHPQPGKHQAKSSSLHFSRLCSCLLCSLEGRQVHWKGGDNDPILCLLIFILFAFLSQISYLIFLSSHKYLISSYHFVCCPLTNILSPKTGGVGDSNSPLCCSLLSTNQVKSLFF